MNQQKITELETIINSEYSNTAGIVVLKNGKTLYENHFNNCTAASTIHVYSVTKSIISILIGIAIDKGYIKSINQKVLEFFPDYTVKEGEETIQSVTLKNLLTMTAPYKHEAEPYIEYFTGDDHVNFTLDLLGGLGPVGAFRYTPLVGPDILSGILVSAVGESVFDFASRHLFSPLNITVENSIVFQSEQEQLAFNEAQNISGWAADRAGINTAGWGLSLTAADMAKIGQLVLDNGRWEDKQIVSAKWINESTKEHSRWTEAGLLYGYLWWVLNENEYAAMGDGGNVIYINAAKNTVIAIASLFTPDAKDRINLIKEYIEPILEDCE